MSEKWGNQLQYLRIVFPSKKGWLSMTGILSIYKVTILTFLSLSLICCGGPAETKRHNKANQSTGIDLVKTRQISVKDITSNTVYDTPPVLIRSYIPDVPSYIECRKDSCRVLLICEIDETGRVTEATVSESTTMEIFEQAAIAAAVKFTFEPARVNDKPVKSRVGIPFEF